MRKNKLVSLMVLGVVTFSMTACGDKLTKLSPENEKAVVSYASAVVSKYNKNQDKGFIRYEEEKKSNEDETKNETKQEDDTNNNSTNNGGSDGSGTNSSTTNNESTVSINDALAIEGMTFTSQGTKVEEKYTYGDYYALLPSSGNSFVVYTVKGKNTSSAEINLDLLSKKYKYNFIVNGTDVVANDTTILLNDLSTYQANIKPGEEVELILLFQFPKSKLNSMTNQAMEMIKNDQAIKIGL